MRQQNWFALAGLVYVIVWIVGLLIQSDTPPTTATDSELTTYFLTHRQAHLVQTYLIDGIAGVALLVFATTLAAVLRTFNNDMYDSAANIVMGAGMVAASISLVQAGMQAVLSNADLLRAEDAFIRPMLVLINSVDTYKLLALACFSGVASLIILRTASLPTWLGWLGILVAITLLIGSLHFIVSHPMLYPILVTSLPLLLLWVGGISIVMLRKQSGEAPRAILPSSAYLLLVLPICLSAFTACTSWSAPDLATPIAEAPEATIVTPVATDSSTATVPTTSPTVDAPRSAIMFTWQTDGGCQMAEISDDGKILQGGCTAPRSEFAFSSDTPTAATDLSYLTDTFAPFTAETALGTVDFLGTGQMQATAAQQRMIAEWSRWITDAAMAGRTSTAAQLVLSWHRVGGFAGFCDDLSVYTYGIATATTCRDNLGADLGRQWLTANQLAQLYTWTDQLSTSELTQSDPATTDALTTTLNFMGTGTTAPTAEQESALLDFAGQLYGEFNNAVGQHADAISTVTLFLTGLQQDPTGEQSTLLLDDTLQAEVGAGQAPNVLLGIQNLYRSFDLTVIETGTTSDEAIIEAELEYATPVHVRFHLLQKDDRWKIDQIVNDQKSG